MAIPDFLGSTPKPAEAVISDFMSTAKETENEDDGFGDFGNFESADP